eukprot:TRINITY_DN7405_c1_g2_i2.p1 TRINITY_DN7405_c1_g2~~TRINITY_DN7405_c1_g2_i2.p1  ORF type:complete len:282 (-),score=39.07 TRINITY_DN7405_c1_g2_i2:131-976(-)
MEARRRGCGIRYGMRISPTKSNTLLGDLAKTLSLLGGIWSRRKWLRMIYVNYAEWSQKMEFMLCGAVLQLKHFGLVVPQSCGKVLKCGIFGTKETMSCMEETLSSHRVLLTEPGAIWRSISIKSTTNLFWKPRDATLGPHQPRLATKLILMVQCSNEARRSGMGVIIRVENGLPIAALSSSGRHVGDAEEVEAYELVRALRFALEVGTRTIIVEGDSLQVIKVVQSPESDFSRIGHIIDEAKAISRMFSSCSFTHVLRNGNRMAHSLAKHAKNDVFLAYLV